MAEEKIDIDAQLGKLADETLDTDKTKIDPDTGLKIEDKKDPDLKTEGEKDSESEKEKLDEHKESSALGRKVKGLEDKFSSVEDKIDILLDAGTQKIEDTDTDIIDEDFIPTTRKELSQFMDKRDNEKEKEAKNYDQKYMNTFSKFKEEEDHDDIINELKENFNFKNTNDGALDAEMNYLKASRAFYRKKSVSGKSETPLKGEKPKGPLGAGSEGERTMDTGSTTIPKLDKFAQDFVDKLGKSEEFVKKAFSADLGTGLTKNEHF